MLKTFLNVWLTGYAWIFWASIISFTYRARSKDNLKASFTKAIFCFCCNHESSCQSPRIRLNCIWFPSCWWPSKLFERTDKTRPNTASFLPASLPLLKHLNQKEKKYFKIIYLNFLIFDNTPNVMNNRQILFNFQGFFAWNTYLYQIRTKEIHIL